MKATPRRYLGTRIAETTYTAIQACAERERRSISSMSELLLERALEMVTIEYELADQ